MDLRTAHQQSKEELGLDHFEGRSWRGLHRHALMTTIAYAFLQHRRLAQAVRKKESTVHRLSRACQPYAKPSSIISSFNHDLSDARTAEEKSAETSSVNKSAKVVLVHFPDFPLIGFRSLTPGPPPFSSMNSTPAFSIEFRIFSTVRPRPPKGPSVASSRLIVGIDTSAAAANCSWDQSSSARPALI
jgi:hypothetical protein